MERSSSKWTVSAAMVCLLCMALMVMSGAAFGAGGQGSPCVDNKDGTVTDNNFGLMWQKATAGPMNWKDAKSYASGILLAGHSDWRLPTKEELQGLYNSPCKVKMDVVNDWYWSSSPYEGYFRTNDAWGVNFSSGVVYNQDVYYYLRVRAVRSGQ
jgi:hypothetical protein